MEIRLEHGPIPEEDARRLLDTWAAEHGVSR
jgi:hypothetical protein